MKDKVLKPCPRIQIPVTCKPQGIILVERDERPLQQHQCSVANGVVGVEEVKSLLLLVASLDGNSFTLITGQSIIIAIPYPTVIGEWAFTLQRKSEWCVMNTTKEEQLLTRILPMQRIKSQRRTGSEPKMPRTSASSIST